MSTTKLPFVNPAQWRNGGSYSGHSFDPAPVLDNGAGVTLSSTGDTGIQVSWDTTDRANYSLPPILTIGFNSQPADTGGTVEASFFFANGDWTWTVQPNNTIEADNNRGRYPAGAHEIVLTLDDPTLAAMPRNANLRNGTWELDIWSGPAINSAQDFWNALTNLTQIVVETYTGYAPDGVTTTNYNFTVTDLRLELTNGSGPTPPPATLVAMKPYRDGLLGLTDKHYGYTPKNFPVPS